MGFLSSEKRGLVSQLKSIDFDPKAIYKFQGGVDNIQQIFSGNSLFSQALDFTGIKITGDGGLDNFGSRVEINRKGDIAFICARRDPTNDLGSIYIYKKNNTNWEFKQKIVGQPQTAFGSSISSNFDGTTFVVGAQGSAPDGRAHVYTGNGNSWSPSAVLSGNPNTSFGISVSINSSGNVIAVGANFDREFCSPLGSICGAVHIFTGYNNNWVRTSKFSSQTNSNFGTDIELNDSGNKIIVGAPGEVSSSNTGAAYLFNLIAGIVLLPGKKITGDLGNDGFGGSVSIDGIGETIVIGARNDTNIPGGFQGAAFVFTGSSQNLFFAKKLSEEPGAFNYFGTDVKINRLGDKIIVGGTAANNFNGAAWIYTGEKQNWGLSKKISGDFGSNDLFGVSVGADLGGSNIIIGAESDNNQSGAAWIFSQNKAENLLYKEINTIPIASPLTMISSNKNGNIIAVTNRYNNQTPTGEAHIYYRGIEGILNKKIQLNGFDGKPSGINKIALNDIGDICVVGGSASNGQSGKAWVFIENSGNWNLKSSISTNGIFRFGESVNINSSGNIIIIGTPSEGLGSLNIFTGNKEYGWNFCQKIKLSDFDANATYGGFGNNISINDSGNIIAVEAPNYTHGTVNNLTGAVFIFTGNNFIWNLNKKIQNSFNNVAYVSNLKLNKNGDKLFIGSPRNSGSFPANLSGFVEIYTGVNSDWGLESKIVLNIPNRTSFGSNLSINDSGNIFYTSSDSQIVYMYKYINNEWNLTKEFSGINLSVPLENNGEGNLLFIGQNSNIKEYENKNISVYEQGSLSGYKRNLAFDGEKWTDFNEYKNNNYNIPKESLVTLNTEQNINIQTNINSKFSKYREGEFFDISKKDTGGGQFVFKKLNQLNEKGFFPALGNHDYDDSNGTGNEFLQYFSFLKKIKGNTSGKEKYYDFKIKNCHFFVLDSDPVVGGSNKDGNIANGAGKGDGNPNTTSNNIYVAQQKTWFNNAIKNSTSKYKFVFFHHPCYSSGPVHGGHPRMSIEQGWKFHLADFVFHGHEHLYERSKRTQTQQYPIYPNFVFTRLSSTQLKIEYYFPGIAWNTTQLRINIGHDDWQDIIVQANMYKNNNNGWEYIYTFPEGSDTVNFAVRTNGGIWDNNTIGGQAYNYIYYLNDSNDFSKTRFITNGNGGVGLYSRIPLSVSKIYINKSISSNINNVVYDEINPESFTKTTFSAFFGNFNIDTSNIWVSEPFRTSGNQRYAYAICYSLLRNRWEMIEIVYDIVLNRLDFTLALRGFSDASLSSGIPTYGWVAESDGNIDFKITRYKNIYQQQYFSNMYGYSKINVYKNALMLQHFGMKKDGNTFFSYDEDTIGDTSEVKEDDKELEFAIVADWGLPNNGGILVKPNDFFSPIDNYYVNEISKNLKNKNIDYIFGVGDLNYINGPLTRQSSSLPFYIDENIGRFYSEYINCYRGAYEEGVLNNSLVSNLQTNPLCESYKNLFDSKEKKDITYNFVQSGAVSISPSYFTSLDFDTNKDGTRMFIGNSRIETYKLNQNLYEFDYSLTKPQYAGNRFGESIKCSKGSDENTLLIFDQSLIVGGVTVVTGNKNNKLKYYNYPRTFNETLETEFIVNTATVDLAYGQSVAINKDGNILAVGIPYQPPSSQGGIGNRGGVNIHFKQNNEWITGALLTGDPEDRYFGTSLAFNKSGNLLFVGGEIAGSNMGFISMFTGSGYQWNKTAKISGAQYGLTNLVNNLILKENKNILFASMFNHPTPAVSGRVSILTGNLNNWNLATTLINNDNVGTDRFGYNIDTNDEANVLAVSTSKLVVGGTNAVYIFTGQNNSWNQVFKITGDGNPYDDRFGIQAPVSFNGKGNILAVGVPYFDLNDQISGTDAGAVYLYTGSGNNWNQVKKIFRHTLLSGLGDYSSYRFNANFGSSVRLNNSGDILLVGCPNYPLTNLAEDGGSASQSSNTAFSGGAIYLYTGINNWTEAGRFTHPRVNTTLFYQGWGFGKDIILNGDENIFVTPMPKAVENSKYGVVYINKFDINEIKTAIPWPKNLNDENLNNILSLNGRPYDTTTGIYRNLLGIPKSGIFNDLGKSMTINSYGNKCAVLAKQDCTFCGMSTGEYVIIYNNIFPAYSKEYFRYQTTSYASGLYFTNWIITDLIKVRNGTKEIKINDQMNLLFCSYSNGIDIYSGTQNGNWILKDTINLPETGIPFYMFKNLYFSDVNNYLSFDPFQSIDIASDGSRIIFNSCSRTISSDTYIVLYDPDRENLNFNNTIYVYDLSGDKWINTYRITNFNSDSPGLNFANQVAIDRTDKDIIGAYSFGLWLIEYSTSNLISVDSFSMYRNDKLLQNLKINNSGVGYAGKNGKMVLLNSGRQAISMANDRVTLEGGGLADAKRFKYISGEVK